MRRVSLLFRRGAKVRVVWITDQNAAFLLFIARHGLKPGASATIVDADRAAQSITVQAQSHTAVTMAIAAAERILCENVRK